MIPTYRLAPRRFPPTIVRVNFSEPVSGGTDFTVNSTINDIVVESASSSGNSLDLFLSAEILGPDEPRLGYYPEEDPVVDGAGNELARVMEMLRLIRKFKDRYDTAGNNICIDVRPR